MQLTLVRHGEYDTQNGHLTDEGIFQISTSALLLGNAARDMLEISLKTPSNTFQLPVGTEPDIILTSAAVRAKESGAILQMRLEEMGCPAELRTDIAYLNELSLDSGCYAGHQCLNKNQIDGLRALPEIQSAIDFIKRLAAEGHQHIVVVSHQPNIQILMAHLCNCYEVPPKAGKMYGITFNHPDELGAKQLDFGVGYSGPGRPESPNPVRISLHNALGLLCDLQPVSALKEKLAGRQPPLPEKAHTR